MLGLLSPAGRVAVSLFRLRAGKGEREKKGNGPPDSVHLTLAGDFISPFDPNGKGEKEGERRKGRGKSALLLYLYSLLRGLLLHLRGGEVEGGGKEERAQLRVVNLSFEGEPVLHPSLTSATSRR